MEKYGSISNFSADTLLEEGIVLLHGVINGELAQRVVCQLLYLEKKYPFRPIQLFINSPGGEVNAGMAIYDAINYVNVDVETVGIGCAASMAALLLSSGTRGRRSALPNTEILIHQPLGGAEGQAADIIIAAKHIERTRDRLNSVLAYNTGKSIRRIAEDTDRDYVMYADEALEYGLIDEVISTIPKAWRAKNESYDA